jgi:uncharacterized membrane protein
VSSPASDVPPPAKEVEQDLPPALANSIVGTLTIGVGISAVLAVVGLVALLTGSVAGFTSAVAHGTPFTPSGFVAGLFRGKAVDILLLALLVLIATPLTRVVISLAMFAHVGDRPFTVLTLTVLLLLGASVVIGALT